MYDFTPPAIYAHQSVLDDPRGKRRMDRVLTALDNPPEVKVYRDEDLPGLIADGLLGRREPMGTMGRIPDAALLFNTFRFDGRKAERMQWLRDEVGVGGHTAEGLLGYGAFDWFDRHRNAEAICRPCWRIHLQNGCLHKCHYCPLGGVLITMVNVEEYLEQLDVLMDAHPWQETYLLEDDADVPGLEPELDALGPIIEHFGRRDDRYLIMHTKSANVDWMLDLAHNGKTIFVWSISGPTQQERFEPATATTVERIDAAGRAQRAGYPVRYKFKPIIPVQGWREDADKTIDMIFQRTDPDVISLAVYMWMDAEEMVRRLDEDVLDGEFLAAARRQAEQLADKRTRPFPRELRMEIYRHHLRRIRRHSAEIPVSLSTESPEIWREMARELGADLAHYTCGCGPNATPGRKKLACSAFDIAQAPEAERFVNL